MHNSAQMHHQRTTSGKKHSIIATNLNGSSTSHGIKIGINGRKSSSSSNNMNIFNSKSKLDPLSNGYFDQHQQNYHQSNSTMGNFNVDNGNTINNSNGAGPLDSFPRSFVSSMKTLFDILDEKQTGFVKLDDIEKGWQDDGSKGLPSGVIESLRKVTPSNGLLSFERFCAGLKISLLRNQTKNNEKTRRLSSDNILLKTTNKSESTIDVNPNKEMSMKTLCLSSSAMRPPSAPLLDIENPKPNIQWNSNTATVRPMPGQRTLSLPQLSPGESDDMEMLPSSDSIDPLLVLHSQPVSQEFYCGAPPKPPRTGLLSTQNANGILTCASNSGPTVINLPLTQAKQIGASSIDKAEIRSALQNWQMGVLMNEMESKEKWCNDYTSEAIKSSNRFLRGTADGGSTDISNSNRLTDVGPQLLPSNEISQNQSYMKKSNSKRREPRRHTLQNGVDYNLLKRLKQYEDERDLLYQGISAVEKAREWYLQQISVVQEKIKYLGRMGSHVEQWSEVHQERIDFQRARVHEINRHLSTLADTWERGGYPMHMNLAVGNGNSIRTRDVLVRAREKE